MPWTQCMPTIEPIGPSTRYRFDCTRIKSAATAKNPRLRMVHSVLSARLLRRRRARARLALLGVGQNDEHLFEPRKIYRGLGFDRLIDAEIPLLDFFDARHWDAARKATTDAAGHEHITDLDVMRTLHVFDAREVALTIPDAAHEAARSGALDRHVDAETAVHRELYVDLFTGDAQHRPDGAVYRDDRHVRADDGILGIDREVRHSKVLGRVFAHDDGAHELLRDRVAQPEQPTQP